MKFNRSTTKDKWTIMKYMQSFPLMVAYAEALKKGNDLTEDNIKDILKSFEDSGVYNPRYGGSVHTGTFKIIQLAWYMFGYYKKGTKNKKFVFTPLGELLLNNLNNSENVSKIFLTMLFGNGFKQPFSKMTNEFNLYPFRLIFKLLREPRLKGKLNLYEVFYFCVFLKEIDIEIYESLVDEILYYRSFSNQELFKLFLENENIVAQSLHETNYLFNLLQSAGILTIDSDSNFKKIGTLIHGNGSGKRAFIDCYVNLNKFVIDYVDVLLASYPFYEKPYLYEKLNEKFSSDILLEMYNFYPSELLFEIGIEDDVQHELSELLSIVRDVEKLSTNENDGDFNKFEVALKDTFNIFLDVNAERISGSGNTDIHAKYYPKNSNVKNFNIEAKSRRVKLEEINSGRIKHHMILTGAEYTLVVSSNFTYSIKYDIKNTDIVTIKASTLSNYMYNYITKHGRHISFNHLDNLIENNRGKDITNDLQEYIYSNFSYDIP